MSEKLPSLEDLLYRDAISKLSDDTTVEESVAAVFLGMTLKTLKQLRAADGGPRFVKISAAKSKGLNQAVTYVMKELRRYRESMQASSTIEVARRQGLLGWVSGIEPFWADEKGQILDAAWNLQNAEWAELFCKAVGKKIEVLWMAPRDAAGEIWIRADRQREYVEDYVRLLKDEVAGIEASIEATELNEIVEKSR